ncbi:Isoflavone reductase-like protein [Lachnellula hyalina]|uniref:Isoflavone reductase-like protein n=1 Tax=Lachnellula hyalina TaxID=1316788 RepID=A0A8H8R0K0_9HELO|nr:Isoflavone reductase-like protein [Lachnellula hyalina]TVY25550.1 Isoflavone reductase-like protein [Lachnellula hyalina]
MSPIKVALAGATGNLGVSVLEALLGANLHVTVLSRIHGNSSKLAPHPRLTITEVDFSSTQSLVAALQGAQVVISCLATLAIGSQNPLIEASVAAGVTRFIPAEFGMDSRNPLCVVLPVCEPKVNTQKYLQEKANSNPEFSYTGIANGLFLDWGLKVGFILNLALHSATLYNGGDVPFSTTMLGDVAKAILGVIDNLEQTANRILYIHSAVTTQNTLIQYAKDEDSKEWNTSIKDTDEIRQEALAELAQGTQGNIQAAMDGFCVCASWNTKYGCDFSSHLDNDLLGVKMMEEDELRATQYSSCDACRQSRVACDALKNGHQPGGGGGSCSKCVARNVDCTFKNRSLLTKGVFIIKWIKKSPCMRGRGSEGGVRKDLGSGLVLTAEGGVERAVSVVGGEPSIGGAETDNTYCIEHPRAPSPEIFAVEPDPKSTDTPSSNAESVDNLLTHWCEQIFHHGFGSIFGHWVGRNGCPFVNDPTSDIFIAPLKLFGELDACMDKQLDGNLGYTLVALEKRAGIRYQIEQSLRRAMQSFAAQWLPAMIPKTVGGPIQYEEVVTQRWRIARRDMLKVINRTSYQSVLALYLFGQTPVPLGISEEEEMDGISGMVCTQTALLQLQQLRERLRGCQFSGSGVSGWSDAVTGSVESPNLTQAFLDLESRAYWVAVIWDTTSSVTLNIRSSLTSGLKGACLEPAWRLARGFLVGSFHAKSKDWHKKGFEVSDEIATQIISAAAVGRLYTWRTIASMKEALREGVEGSDVLFAWDAFLDALNVFKTTIYPLLSNCERRLHFLGPVERLNWYEVVLHYHLGILILADALEAANRLDLLSQLTETRLDAEQESFNVLRFGLESRYKIYAPLEVSSIASDVNSNPYSTGQPITTSFIAIDPYPHHVVASVRLMKKAISRKYRQGNIKLEAYSHLSSTLLEALEQLPQSSKMAQCAREKLQASFQLNV